MILLASGLSWKTLVLIAGLGILVYGMFLGPKSKGTEQKHYDEKEKSQIRHHLRASEGGKDYAFKGSGKYRDSKGNVKKDR